ncbi:hypothetical protein ACIBJC_08570 [Streptomyces sp. NPDC050509]|uniref:hypothetical protein n=1 Tax=Streptomyces sp. NPDC050509 TaxID=3365620 RepID=UPI0037A541FD
MPERFGEQMPSGRCPRQFSARPAREDIRSVPVPVPEATVATMIEERLRALVEAGYGEDNFTRLARRE